MNKEPTRIDYAVLLKQLRHLISDGSGEGEEAATLRNQMDDIWPHLTPEDIEWVDNLLDNGCTEQFEAWKKSNEFQLTYLYDRVGEFGPDIEAICRRAFEAGLNTCTCDGCIRHSSSCFDVEEYYE